MMRILWRVYQRGSFVGYVRGFSERRALEAATAKYGENVRVEPVVQACTTPSEPMEPVGVVSG